MTKFMCAFAVLALMAVTVTADGLTCYECPTGCKGDDPKAWPTQQCGVTPPGSEKVCLKEVREVKGSPNKVVRKCAIVNTGNTYKCNDIPGETVHSCDTCKTDLCNSASSITFSSLAIASIVLPFLATRLY